MSTSWQTVRVFISSTFRDMHAERDHLVRVVFPALREKLLPYRMHLDDIDLRWGVTQEQADRDMALDLCLDQIDRSRPFFVGILGERYGYVPGQFTEEAVSKYGWIQHITGKSITELEIFYGVLRQPAMQPRALFFFRDPAFIGQMPEPLRAQARAENPEAEQNLARLKKEIRDARLPTPPVEHYPCRFAGLRINWRLARFALPEPDAQALEAIAADGLVTPQEYDTLDAHLREIVNQHGVLYLDGLEEFGRAVGDRLWAAIKAEHGLPDTPPARAEGQRDELAEELDFHRRFIESRLRVYVGRGDVQRKLTAFADGDEPLPALVTGRSGSGKSAALARFVTAYEETHPDALVIPHFVGASPGSTNLRLLLRRLCLTLQREFAFTDAVQREGQPPETGPAEVPQTVNELVPRFRDFVARVPADRRVVILIDALNQLDEADNAHLMYWLPREFPPHVKVILSCVADPGRPEQALRAFEHRPHRPVEIADLTEGERQEIVREVPSLSAKTLDHLQVAMLLDNPATGNPLFLLVALEELRGFGSFEHLDLRIAAFPRPSGAPLPRPDSPYGEPAALDLRMRSSQRYRDRWANWAAAVPRAPHSDDPTTDIFKQVIERLEQDFDPAVGRRLLKLLACAYRGLSDREMLELIESVGTRIDQSTTDLFPILRQIRAYLLHRGELNGFYHSNFLRAVLDLFLQDDAEKAITHKSLANYFAAQDYFLEDLDAQRERARRLPPTPRPVNIRKVDELPWQLLQVAKLAGRDEMGENSPHWDAVADLLTDWQFLEAKAEA